MMLRDPSLIPLSHEHQHALALCVLIDRSTGDADTQARMIVDQYDAEMKSHFEAEERVLFPAAAALPETRDLSEELVSEHRRLQAMVDALRGRADAATIAEFTATLRQHVRKEEGVLFEELQRLLPREQLDDIGKLLR
jgi:hemerythrin-like domain-containing protein